MTEEEHIARALDAESILKNPLVIETFGVLTKKILDRFAQTNPRDEKELAYLRRMLQTVADFKTHFEEVLRKGEDARAVIRDRERRGLLGRLNA